VCVESKRSGLAWRIIGRFHGKKKENWTPYRRHFNAAIIRIAPNMAETRATTTSIGIHVFSVLGSVGIYKNKDVKL
jgi:hypothetical protein